MEFCRHAQASFGVYGPKNQCTGVRTGTVYWSTARCEAAQGSFYTAPTKCQ
eukprot:COSAG02_NODE_127_length_34879_cov_12.705060_21_plen_51_part_00